jgi:UDP-N-acetylmuramoyl-tripeptide--D-alanyl-D-alanine ligase
MLAIALSHYYFQMSLEEIKKALEKITLKDSSFRFLKTKKGFFILDSTYSANPQSVLSHLNYLSFFEGKKIFIFPSLIELGERAKEIHERIGREMGKQCDFVILTSKDFFKELKEQALKSGLKKENIFLIEDPKKIFEKIKTILKTNDVILLEGRLSPLLVSLLENYGNENC